MQLFLTGSRLGRTGLARRCVGVLSACVAFLVALPAAHAGYIINGGFESGLSGWTTVNQGGGGFVSQFGGQSPLSGFPVPLPPQGVRAAMTDSGPGGHVLFQDFVVPVGGFTTATLTFKYLIRNLATQFIIGAGDLNNLAVPNQQARVDILRAGPNPFSTAASDVLANVYQTKPGDILSMNGYLTVTYDLTSLFQSHAGQTLRLRFGEVDDQYYFVNGIDDVDIVTSNSEPAVPLPPTGASLAVLAMAFAAFRRFALPLTGVL